MDRILTSLIAVSLLLTSCNDEPKIVSDSPAKFKQSIADMGNSLESEDQKALLALALKSGARSFLGNPDKFKTEIEGMSAQEIIDYTFTKEEQVKILSGLCLKHLMKVGTVVAVHFSDGKLNYPSLEKFNFEESIVDFGKLKPITYHFKEGQPYDADPKKPIASIERYGYKLTVFEDGSGFKELLK